MKHTLTVSTEQVSQHASADFSRVPGGGDIDRRVLHVVPRLLIPPAAVGHVRVDEVKLNIATTLGATMLPPGGVRIRRPYPNSRYLVAGSVSTRNGWLISLPEWVNEIDVEFEWTGLRGGAWTRGSDDWTCTHLLHMKFLAGEGRFYTMDADCWPEDAVGEMKCDAIALTGHPDDADRPFPDGFVIRRFDVLREDAGGVPAVAGHFLEQSIAIPSIRYDQAWTMHAYDRVQLHEIEQVTQFRAGDEEHMANSTVEMPASLLVQAIQCARSLPAGQGSLYAEFIKGAAGGAEGHPALTMLRNWWSVHRPDDRKLAIGYAVPWVRALDDGMYRCASGDSAHDFEIKDLRPGAKASARVGNLVLILFFSSWSHFQFAPHQTTVLLSDGTSYCTTTTSRAAFEAGLHDEARLAIEALAAFPDRFPAAWRVLLETSG